MSGIFFSTIFDHIIQYLVFDFIQQKMALFQQENCSLGNHCKHLIGISQLICLCFLQCYQIWLLFVHWATLLRRWQTFFAWVTYHFLLF